ncbi:hypothetical protein [Crossiella sp. CA198]|uniref:hypothetical protein n=1 Tax=Crossiella sp. CA198 TaxID=3455607 RepID=UPI003F8D8079
MGLLAIPLGIGAAVGAEPRTVAGQLIAAPAAKPEPEVGVFRLRGLFEVSQFSARPRSAGTVSEALAICTRGAERTPCSFQ